MRVLRGAQPELVTPALQMAARRVVTRHLLAHAGLNADKGRGGLDTPIQRFESTAIRVLQGTKWALGSRVY
jgi:hypothetical protein